MCRDILLDFQSCIPSLASSSEAYILNGAQEELETSANMLQAGFNLLGASEACKAAALPLLCLYMFGLCDGSGRGYLPSRSECVNVSTGVCAVEFQAAMTFPGADQLPQCDSLQEDSFKCTCELLIIQ